MRMGGSHNPMYYVFGVVVVFPLKPRKFWSVHVRTLLGIMIHLPLGSIAVPFWGFII